MEGIANLQPEVSISLGGSSLHGMPVSWLPLGLRSREEEVPRSGYPTQVHFLSHRQDTWPYVKDMAIGQEPTLFFKFFCVLTIS